MKLAVVGADGDHAEEFLRIFNGDRRFPGVAVSHAWTSDLDRAPALAARFGLALERDLDRLSGCVDGALVVDRDGGAHLEHARPFLERGLPVFVDKPLACSLTDAEELVGTAQKHGAVLATGSALRWLAGLGPIVEQAAACDPVTVSATGPADPHSPHGGGFFYGSHIVELLLEVSSRLAGATPRLRHTATAQGSVVLGAREAGIALRAHLLDSTSVGYQIDVEGRRGRVSAELELDDDYMLPVARTFVDAVATGEWPMAPEAVLAPIHALVEYQRCVDGGWPRDRAADAGTR